MIITTNAPQVANWFQQKGKEVSPAVQRVIQRSGIDLLTAVKRFASGYAGGPEIITGRYNSSIRLEYQFAGNTFQASVGTDEPYGYLLEEGGTVSGGMFGDEEHTVAAHPHFLPAAILVESQLERQLGLALEAVFK